MTYETKIKWIKHLVVIGGIMYVTGTAIGAWLIFAALVWFAKLHHSREVAANRIEREFVTDQADYEDWLITNQDMGPWK